MAAICFDQITSAWLRVKAAPALACCRFAHDACGLDVLTRITAIAGAALAPSDARVATLREQRHPWHANCFGGGIIAVGVAALVDDVPSNKISRRTALVLPLGLAASGTVFSSHFAGAAEKPVEPTRGGTMVMIVQPEPSTLAHYAVTAGNIPPIATQIYEGLVTYDWDLKPQPNLASSWEIAPDGKSITFKLREGVVFHNGAPFTSADVQFSFMEVLKKYHPFAPLLLAELTAVDTPDPATAILRLANPAPYLMQALAGRDLPIVCKSVFEGTPILQNPTANKPIGTGPFKFGQWERGQFVRLDRNEKYWKPGLPYLDHIIARFIPASASRPLASMRRTFAITTYRTVWRSPTSYSTAPACRAATTASALAFISR
jgi:ABC-type transport system substrate-binding protein